MRGFCQRTMCIIAVVGINTGFAMEDTSIKLDIPEPASSRTRSTEISSSISYDSKPYYETILYKDVRYLYISPRLEMQKYIEKKDADVLVLNEIMERCKFFFPEKSSYYRLYGISHNQLHGAAEKKPECGGVDIEYTQLIETFIREINDNNMNNSNYYH